MIFHKYVEQFTTGDLVYFNEYSDVMIIIGFAGKNCAITFSSSHDIGIEQSFVHNLCPIKIGEQENE